MITPLDEARNQWGNVFNTFRLACERVNAAWYHVEDKDALKEEDVHRLHTLIKQAQNVIHNWEETGKP